MALRPVVVRRFCFTAKHAVKRNPLVSFLVVAGIFVLFCYLSSGSNEKQSHDVEFQQGPNANQLAEAPTPLPGAPDPNTRFDNSKPGNYEPKEPEKVTNDRGERGEAAFPKDDEERQQSQHAMREFGFNTVISDAIRMERTIPDIRPAECKYWNYPEDLPTVSVVIVFHNEGWSPLLRTVHTVVLRSPRHLLKQVVMVDDFSDKEHLGKKLEDYLEREFKDKVEVVLVRNKEREGLIRARTIGAQHATADVVLFLDAHCEVNVNWLPPLLAPIKHNKRVMTVPVIDGIDMNTWEYRSVYGSPDRHFRGIFEWGLLYKETEIPAQERADRTHDSQPFRSPTHAGGLFAISREWFKELGYYDPGLQIWGGEQYELSFKIWQCGGGILFVPCSHVGHVYRNHMPYGFGKLSGKPVISTNMLRVIRTWMDEYGDLYFIREPSAKHRTPGDISEQLELRKRLQCKSFDWFMKNVAYDVPVSYPILPKNKVWGEAKNLATGKCIDTMGRAIPGTVGATPCHGYGGNQLIRLNEQGQMCQGEWCITPQGSSIRTGHCQKGTANGPFDYDKETQMITYKRGSTCLTADSSQGSSELLLKRCDKDNANQKWVWREIFTD